MRLSYQWLQDYVDIKLSPEELADKLTMAGLAVETVTHLGQGIDNVVVGQIVSIELHPNADRLRICQVDIGGKVLQIVTGATNVQTRHVVPVALCGAHLANGVHIKASKLRGVESNGMLCSAQELGMDPKTVALNQREGIYLLPPDTELGQDALAVMGLRDSILEFELTANRADCFCALGIAREVAALTGCELNWTTGSVLEKGEKTSSLTSVTVEDANLCPRFMARVFENVKIGPSPLWMQRRLQSAGMRPINNVVDITNFVMLEYNQPMHAYDYRLLARHKLIVRKALKGETLTTLDDVKRQLDSDMLVIADAVQPVGIAGVMGGLATEVTPHTNTILLEAAAFAPTYIRRTAKKLNLRSEASQRFEKGVDIANIQRALDRAARLLCELTGATACEGVIDEYGKVAMPAQITVSVQEINKWLGTRLNSEQMTTILAKLDFEVNGQDVLKITAPTRRIDVSRPADIAEEIARCIGFENIPATLPKGNYIMGRQSCKQQLLDKLRTLLVENGMTETISFSFTHPSVFDRLRLSETDPLRNAIPVLNPITDELSILRTTLLGNILETAARNLSRKVEDISIFELGAAFWPDQLPLHDLPQEPVSVVGVMTGRRDMLSWNHSRDLVDFYDIKGILENTLDGMGIKGYSFVPTAHPSLHPGKSAAIMLAGEIIGIVGQVHPLVAEAFDLSKPVYIFEVDTALVIDHADDIPQCQGLPRYPAVERDLAVIVPQDSEADTILTTIRTAGGELLTSVVLFDVYRGGQVPSGYKSLAYQLLYRALDRTLTDDEVDQVHQAVISTLEQQCHAQLRA